MKFSVKGFYCLRLKDAGCKMGEPWFQYLASERSRPAVQIVSVRVIGAVTQMNTVSSFQTRKKLFLIVLPTSTWVRLCLSSLPHTLFPSTVPTITPPSSYTIQINSPALFQHILLTTLFCLLLIISSNHEPEVKKRKGQHYILPYMINNGRPTIRRAKKPKIGLPFQEAEI